MKRLWTAAVMATLAGAADVRVRVTETAGIARDREPVEVSIGGRPRILFVTIGAKASRVFNTAELTPGEDLTIVQSDRVGFRVENSVFRADLSGRTNDGKLEDSGTLRALTFKTKGVTLERTPNRMHWAPSFQRAGAKGYTSIATWTPVDKFSHARSPGALMFRRQGRHADYPEIALDAEYRFFSHAPYFLFRSTMTIERPIDMYWLRNQEMTMDDLFTHVAWPGRDGKPRLTDFEARKPLLDSEPIAVDAPWVAFLHRERGYGFGAVVLEYRATKTARAMTSINDGARNGRYWDRRLINQVSTPLDRGDRYDERTAYVLFRPEGADPLAEFFAWEKRLRNPLAVEVLSNR